jgi:hypothetical protein
VAVAGELQSRASGSGCRIEYMRLRLEPQSVDCGDRPALRKRLEDMFVRGSVVVPTERLLVRLQSVCYRCRPSHMR